jgi:cytochrome o ubiquinol oxidase subunit 3
MRAGTFEGDDLMEHAYDADGTDVFGFWLYIMTDCVLFACLFATYIVLTSGMQHGVTLKNYVELSDVLIETFLLLASNFTFCLAALNLNQPKIAKVQWCLIMTFLFGAGFIYMELIEFARFAAEGFRWDVSASASAFFTLVGTHGLHVSFGLLWILVMILQLPQLGLSSISKRRLTYLGLFWNFLDIVWIFVFTVVYLMGAM